MHNRGEATYDIYDDRLRAEFYERLPQEDYEAVKRAGFQWWPGQKIFSAVWTPEREDLLRDRFGIEVEHVERVDDPEARVDRFDRYANNAARHAQAASDRAHSIADGIPMGQPILVGHHSERHHRADIARIDSAMGKAVHEQKRAEYWRDRAVAAAARADRHEQPGVILRRIQKLEAEQRAIKRDQAQAQERGVERAVARCQRWINHLEDRLVFERAMYEASGGVPAVEEVEVAAGDFVFADRRWYKVLKVNRKTVKVHTPWSEYNIDKSKIAEVRKAEDGEPEKLMK